MKQQQDIRVEAFLDLVTNKIAFKEARAAVRREMQGHIEEHIEVAESYGMDRDRAIADSLKRMGEAEEIGISLNQVHKPRVDFGMIGLVVGLCRSRWST